MNGEYLVGEDTEKTYKTNIGAGGWYPQNKSELSVLNFSKDSTEACKIVGWLNLKSYFDKIIQRERDGVINIENLEIIQIKEK